MTASVVKARIERVVHPPNWRGTRYATFLRDSNWMCCEVYFEDGEPRMQIRSLVFSLEEAAIVAVAIQMACDWAVEELERMKASKNPSDELTRGYPYS